MLKLKKKRNAIVAALLTLFGGGVGLLYVGRFWYALGLSLAPIIIFALAAWSGLLFTAVGLYAVLLFLVLLWIGTSVAAAIWARRAGEAVLRPYQRWYYYLLWFVAFALICDPILTKRAELFGYETFRFPSSSMRETLLPGDMFVSNTWKYRDAQPARGELVVFRFPGDPSVKYVKRVIGLPGDTVEMKGGAVHVSGKQLHEPYVTPANNVRTATADLRFVVPPDSFFVLGDNRDHSNDSRYWGFVRKDHLHGNVEQIWLSYGEADGMRFERIGLRVK